MAETETQEEYTVLNVEIDLISSVADAYVVAAKKHEVDESDIIAKILEVIANNDGMIDALLENDNDDSISQWPTLYWQAWG